MDIPPALLQFGGSLIAILVLAAIARAFGLGKPPRLVDEADARHAADEAVSGFDPEIVALDREGAGAIVRDNAGRVLLLRPHGSHFAGRLLTAAARAHIEGETLVIDTAERRFGRVWLDIPDQSAWVQAINGLGSGDNA